MYRWHICLHFYHNSTLRNSRTFTCSIISSSIRPSILFIFLSAFHSCTCHVPYTQLWPMYLKDTDAGFFYWISDTTTIPVLIQTYVFRKSTTYSGSMLYKVIRNHDIGFVRWSRKSPCQLLGMIRYCCAVAISRSYQNMQLYFFLFQNQISMRRINIRLLHPFTLANSMHSAAHHAVQYI